MSRGTGLVEGSWAWSGQLGVSFWEHLCPPPAAGCKHSGDVAPLQGAGEGALSNQGSGQLGIYLSVHQVLRWTLPMSVLKESPGKAGVPQVTLTRKVVPVAPRPWVPHISTSRSRSCCIWATGREIQGPRIPSRYLTVATALSYPLELQQSRAAGLEGGGGGGGGKRGMGWRPAQLHQTPHVEP